MRLSRKSDYALRAVRHIATLPKGKLGSINSVSEAENIPREFLAKILKDLTRSGILVSYQGVTGGYRLSRLPKDVTFLDVIEAIDGPILLNECVAGNGVCTFGEDCPMRPIWCDAQAELVDRLKQTTFSNFIQPANVAVPA